MEGSMQHLLKRIVRFWGLGLILMCLLSGCTPQQRLTRLINRHPCLVADTLLHVSVSVPIPSIGASFHVPARPDTTFEVTDTSSNVTVRVCLRLSDSTIGVEVDRPADTIKIDTALSAPRLKVEASPDKASRRKQIIFAVCFCFGCVTIWFLSVRLKPLNFLNLK